MGWRRLVKEWGIARDWRLDVRWDTSLGRSLNEGCDIAMVPHPLLQFP